ncbi:MAG: hypothetical protein AAGH15_12755 [Myxococcota bacterium]
MRDLLSFALVVGLTACAGTTPGSDSSAGPETSGSAAPSGPDVSLDAERWPRDFVAGPGNGPALYLDERAESPAIGYLTEGARVRIRGFPADGRVPVNIDGRMKVRAHLAADRLALRVQARAALEGTPVYFGPGDYVRVFGPDPVAGQMRVAARPDLGRGPEVEMPSFEGAFPTAQLALDAPEGAEALAAGTPMRLPAGVAVPLYATPTEVVAELPALDPPLVVSVLRDRGRWKGVRVGVGPYLVGYIDTQATPLEAADALPVRAAPTPLPAGSVPTRIAGEDDQRPLLQIASGTRVRFGDGTIAILEDAGFAREWDRFPDTNEVDVFVAVDDVVAVRGLVPVTSATAAP